MFNNTLFLCPKQNEQQKQKESKKENETVLESSLYDIFRWFKEETLVSSASLRSLPSPCPIYCYILPRETDHIPVRGLTERHWALGLSLPQWGQRVNKLKSLPRLGQSPFLLSTSYIGVLTSLVFCSSCKPEAANIQTLKLGPKGE